MSNDFNEAITFDNRIGYETEDILCSRWQDNFRPVELTLMQDGDTSSAFVDDDDHTMFFAVTRQKDRFFVSRMDFDGFGADVKAETKGNFPVIELRVWNE